MEHPAEHPVKKIQCGSNQGAEEKKIPPGAQRQPCRQVKADPSCLQQSGGEKENRQHDEPEKKIQQFPAPSEGQCQAKAAKQVIPQTQKPACGKAQQNGQGLAFGRKTHPRNRRPKKLGWRVSSSS